MGTGMVGAAQTAAHEAGHAVGRQHAPCDDSGRCDSPANTDDDYPSYGSYVSDSTGEFGFDVENNRVFDPATSRDFMGYSGNNWISPYTYGALLATGDPSPSTGTAPAWIASYMALEASEYMGFVQPGRRDSMPATPAGRPEWIKRREPVLFLRVTADSDAAEVHPSFTYAAHRRPRGQATTYEAHVLDAKGGVIACTYLHQACGSCDADCGPVDLIGEIPLDGDPARLLVRQHGAVLATVDFEDPVKLDCDSATTKKGDLKLTWHGQGSGADIWYLVQWLDRDGVWRGVAPRTTNTQMLVPKRYQWAGKEQVRFRILATEVLTTSVCELKFDGCHQDPPVEVTIYDTGASAGALATDPLGRQIPSRDLTWFDEHGGEVGRGDRLPYSAISDGVLRVVPLGSGITRADGTAAVDLGQITPRPPAKPRPRQHPHPHPQPHREEGWHRAD